LDELDAVAAGVGLQRAVWRPAVRAAVVDLLGNRLQWDDIGARAAQQEQCDSAGAGGLEVKLGPC
jgi:hypothetical protein